MAIRTKRTYVDTIDSLLESPRLKLAIANFPHEKDSLKAILIELGMETQVVVKRNFIDTYRKNSDLSKIDIIDLLTRNVDYTGFSLNWDLTEKERALYIADPRYKLVGEERAQVIEELRVKFMCSDEFKKEENNEQ